MKFCRNCDIPCTYQNKYCSIECRQERWAKVALDGKNYRYISQPWKRIPKDVEKHNWDLYWRSHLTINKRFFTEEELAIIRYCEYLLNEKNLKI